MGRKVIPERNFFTDLAREGVVLTVLADPDSLVALNYEVSVVSDERRSLNEAFFLDNAD